MRRRSISLVRRESLVIIDIISWVMPFHLFPVPLPFCLVSRSFLPSFFFFFPLFPGPLPWNHRPQIFLSRPPESTLPRPAPSLPFPPSLHPSISSSLSLLRISFSLVVHPSPYQTPPGSPSCFRPFRQQYTLLCAASPPAIVAERDRPRQLILLK